MKERCIESDPWIKSIEIRYESNTCLCNEGAFRIPSPGLVEILEIEWTGEGATFRNQQGTIVTDHIGNGPLSWGRPLIVRAEALETALSEKGFDIVWCVLAEKTAWGVNKWTDGVIGISDASAVYWLEDGVIKGGLQSFAVTQSAP